MMALVLGPKAARSSSKSILQSSHDLMPSPEGGWRGTNLGLPVLKWIVAKYWSKKGSKQMTSSSGWRWAQSAAYVPGQAGQPRDQ